MASGDGVKTLKRNLLNIAKDPSVVLKEAANAVLNDILVERIDGEKTYLGGPMKGNAASTMNSKRNRGVSPYNHSLWDSQTMRKKSSWNVLRINKDLVHLEPGAVIAFRALNVQRLGYFFFGVSKEGQKAADKAMEKKLRELLEYNVPGMTK